MILTQKNITSIQTFNPWHIKLLVANSIYRHIHAEMPSVHAINVYLGMLVHI